MPSAPNKALWIAALIIGSLGILAHYTTLAELSQYNFQLVMIGFLLLVVGTAYRKI